jgi:hypothetical protein
MSFLSILKRIGSAAVTVEHVAAPVASVVMPQFASEIAIADGMFVRLQNSILTVEANNPVDTDGTLKEQAVINDFVASLGLTQAGLALKGKMVSYDDAALRKAIASQVSAYNAMAAVKASFTIVDIPKPV